MKTLFSISLIAILLLSVSCDRPKCANDNPVFDQNPPVSEVYKAELAKQLALIDQTKLTYWLKEHDEKAGQDYLHFYVQGDGLCAQLVLSAQDWHKLTAVVNAKAVSYRGAEFTNLRYEVRREGGTTQFVFTGYDSIID